ncbi:MAG: UDP-N-acetylmuramoyl-L-alanine--D-glutamate ligase [Coriobacteriales bacterium]|nr:UDP-N-acetylmuramoyl-L-alanine--D-glutamate ligase [Coriobacteriales bacterium]
MCDTPDVGFEPGVASLGDVCVLGAGDTGLGVAGYLVSCGEARVRSVTLFGGARAIESDATRALERAGVRVILGTEQIEGHFDKAIVSPGIPESAPFFQAAQEHADEVMGEPEFAYRESPHQWIAITGTNGKTTTTLLTRELLATGGLKARVVGNIGVVATGQVKDRDDDEWFVAELSSFQLATSKWLHPRVACLLNVTPDHIEWHGSMQEYAAAKERLFANLGANDLAVVSCEDEWCRGIARELDERGLRVCSVGVHVESAGPCAAFVRDGRLVVRLDGVEHDLVSAKSLAIRGEHNIQNALAAAACALEVGVPAAAVTHGLMVFRPLEHRIEACGEVRGVRFVNDSKATNVDATIKALTAFVPGKVVVLLGGHDKGTELDQLAHAVSARCRAAVCYGEAAERLYEALLEADGPMGLDVRRAAHMRDALQVAFDLAQEGDVVLLSPACSSFDEFGNYRERGEVFKELVASLAPAGGSRG